MQTLLNFHAELRSALDRLILDRPSVGWVFASISTSAGVTAFLDFSIRVLSLTSVLLGIVVGIYTLRVQRASLKLKQQELDKDL